MAATSFLCAARLAYLSALAIFIGTLCYFGGLGVEMSKTPDGFNPNSQSSLVQIWKARREARGFYMAADIFIIMGWLMLIPPVSSLCVMLGGTARSATSLIYGCFVLAAIASIVDFLFMAGTITVTDSYSTFMSNTSLIPSDDLSGVPYLSPLQNLELVYRVSRARGYWLATLDHLFLTIGLVAIAFLGRTTREHGLSGQFIFGTILLSVFTFCGFWVTLARAFEYGERVERVLRPAVKIYVSVSLGLFLPLWLTWLGCQLASNTGKEYGFSTFPRAKIDVPNDCSMTEMSEPPAKADADGVSSTADGNGV